MSNLLQPQIKMIETDPEVKSYIYQQVIEFEPYVTPETLITVVTRDPEKLKLQYETDGRHDEISHLKKKYRIAIILKEGDAKLSEEGLADNIFDALRLAKERLISKLIRIQDSVVSKQERIMQIQMAMQNPQLH